MIPQQEPRTIDLVSIKQSIDSILLEKESRILHDWSSPMNYYFRIGEIEVESESGYKSKIKALWCDELARRSHREDDLCEMTNCVEMLNLILQNLDVILLKSAVDYLIEYDFELFDFLEKNYATYPMQLKKLLFHKEGLYLPKQIPLNLILNGESHIPYNQVRVGANLRELRKERGLTQARLAENSDVSERTIRRIESGEYCHFETLKQLALGLQVDISRLLW